jgi:hypothetical protein
MKNNIVRHLSDKCGVSEKQRKEIVANIFGCNGICRQTGTAQLNQQVEGLESLVNKLFSSSEGATKFMKYLNEHVLRQLKENCEIGKPG